MKKQTHNNKKRSRIGLFIRRIISGVRIVKTKGRVYPLQILMNWHFEKNDPFKPNKFEERKGSVDGIILLNKPSLPYNHIKRGKQTLLILTKCLRVVNYKNKPHYEYGYALV